MKNSIVRGNKIQTSNREPEPGSELYRMAKMTTDFFGSEEEQRYDIALYSAAVDLSPFHARNFLYLASEGQLGSETGKLCRQKIEEEIQKFHLQGLLPDLEEIKEACKKGVVVFEFNANIRERLRK